MRGLSTAPDNNALELAVSSISPPARSSTRCYPGVRVGVTASAVAIALTLAMPVDASPPPLVARLVGPRSVVLGEPLRLSLVLTATSPSVLVSTLTHLSIEPEGSKVGARVHTEVPCGDVEGLLQEVSPAGPLTLPVTIHIKAPERATHDTEELPVAFALPTEGRYRIRAQVDTFSDVEWLKQGDPESYAKAKRPIESLPFPVEVVEPESSDLLVFEHYIRPHPGVLLGWACENPADRLRAEAIATSFPGSRYVRLLLGRRQP